MKKLILAATLLVATMSLSAQDDDSKLENNKFYLSGVSGINISQSAFSNWSAGGVNSFAGNAYLNGALKRRSGNWLWVNNLALDYGLTKTKSDGTRKSSDKIDFSTQIGYSTDNKWFYTVMGSFKSQFYKGYDYPNKDTYISKFFAPAYVNVSAGMEYRAKQRYSVFFSPASGKFTFVSDKKLSDMGAFGVDPGDHFKAQLGSYLKARAEQPLMENVNAISSLELFTAYDKSFGNIDVNWDLMISMKINSVLSATINTTLVYDDDIKTYDDNSKPRGAKVQFKEVLGIGLAYNF